MKRNDRTNMQKTSSLYRVKEKWILVATILGSSMVFIDGTIVNVALPALQNDFLAPVSQMQWVVEAYALMLGALLLVGGALGDLYGRKIIFLIGTFIFAAASAWCGFAATITQLIIARGVQGIGAALLVPGSLAIISACFSEKKRGPAIGTWAGFSAITSAVGPILGGWLVQHASWHWIFFLNLPLATIVLLVTILFVPETRNAQRTRGLDLAGACLATLGLGAIVFGLIEWERGGFVIAIAEVIGIVSLLGFLYVEASVSSPMVELNLFRSRNFSGANLLTFCLYFALYGVLFFFPLDLIQVQGYTATEAGAAMLPVILLMFFLSRWSGGLVNRFGARLPLIIGPAITSFGFALFLRSNMNDSYWTTFFPATFVLGIGMAVSIAPLTTVVMNSIKHDHAGVASGVNNAVSRIAGLLAIAILGVVMTSVFTFQLKERLPHAALSNATKQAIFNQRSQLAGIKTNDARAEQLIKEAFVVAYDVLLIIAVLLALISSLSAALFIDGKNSEKSVT